MEFLIEILSRKEEEVIEVKDEYNFEYPVFADEEEIEILKRFV